MAVAYPTHTLAPPLLLMVFFFPGWILVLPVVVGTEQIQGRPQLTGSPEPIRAPLGGDVLLPCVVQPEINMENLTVMWWRPDIPVDPNRYVHLHHENQHQEDLTMPSYVGRTEMFADGLKLGNLSLQIRNLKLSDDGRYRCIIPMLGIATTIMLVLEPPSVETLMTTKHLFPRNLQSADPNQDTDVIGSWSHGFWSQGFWSQVLPICMLVGLVGGLVVYYLKLLIRFWSCWIPIKEPQHHR